MTQMIRVAPPTDREIWSSMRISYDQLKFLAESGLPEAMIIFDALLKQMESDAKEINPAASSLDVWLKGPCDNAIYTMMKQLQNAWRRRLALLAIRYKGQRHNGATDAWEEYDSSSSNKDISSPAVADDITFTDGKGRKRRQKKPVKNPVMIGPSMKLKVPKQNTNASMGKDNGDNKKESSPNRRGRPPKHRISAGANDSDDEMESPSKRRRVRSPKSKYSDAAVGGKKTEGSLKGPRGRPQKRKTSDDAENGDDEQERPPKKPRGRLRKGKLRMILRFIKQTRLQRL